MARYYKSWKTNIKTMYTPMPLEYMAQKIEGKQNEHDYYENLLQGDYQEQYDPYLVNGKEVEQLRQQYRQDLQSLQDELDGTFDYSTVATKINDFRKKYNLTGNVGVSYNSVGTSSNNSGVGGTGTSSSGKSNKGINYSGQFDFMSQPWINAYNYQQWQSTEEAYDKMKDPSSPAYKYYYLDRERAKERERTGGNPRNQRPMDYEVVKPFDENKFYGEVSSQVKGWKSDKTAWLNYEQGGQYVDIATKEYVDFSEVYGNETAGAFGLIWSNQNWQKHMDIMYTYGTERTGAINPEYYAKNYLIPQ